MWRRTPSPFEGYVEPVLPADLPETEARRQEVLTVYGGLSPHPPACAPGFTRARELGMLPPPAPELPPVPLPGRDAHAMLWTAIALAFGSLFVALAVFDFSPWTIGPVTVCWVVAFWLFAVGIPRREEAEHAAGYTSRDNFTGLWRIDRRGAVVREPDRSVPPPGFYPSPYFPGLLQRWEGPGWAPLPQKWRRHAHDYFRRPNRPFLT